MHNNNKYSHNAEPFYGSGSVFRHCDLLKINHVEQHISILVIIKLFFPFIIMKQHEQWQCRAITIETNK